jgi:hypothetical protein
VFDRGTIIVLEDMIVVDTTGRNHCNRVDVWKCSSRYIVNGSNRRMKATGE